MSSYEQFLQTLAQLEQDQSLYEAELTVNEELKGIEHEEVIKLGGLLCKRLQKFAEKGEPFASTLPPDFVPKLHDGMLSYQNLIVPPKIFGGFCPCLKPARDGPEYEKKLLITKAKMVSAVFVAQAVLIESKGEQHNMDSVQYADYVSKMNIVFKTLDEIKFGSSEKALDSARRKLLAAVEAVDKFILLFGDYGGKKEFKIEATKRIKQCQELLNTKQTSAEGVAMPIGKRILIKVLSSLQEIMNSAANLSSSQARENLENLDKLTKLLKKTRETEIAQFGQMEEFMVDRGLSDELSRLREDCEIFHSEASVKLKDATKRWNVVKNQSVPRKVAEYQEDNNVNPGFHNSAELDPSKFFKQTARGIGKVGVIANKFTEGISEGLKDVGNKATKAFTMEDDMPAHAPPPPPKPAKGGSRAGAGSNSNSATVKSNSGSSSNNMMGMFNPLESMMGGGGGDSHASTATSTSSSAGTTRAKSNNTKKDSGFSSAFNLLD